MTSKQEPISRRSYLKYVGGGVVAVAAAAAGYYYGMGAQPQPAQPVTQTTAITETAVQTVTAKKRYKWGLSPYYIDDDWYRVDIIGAQYYADDNNYDLIVQNPHGNIESQIKDIRNMVSGFGAQGIITCATDPTLADTLKWAHDKGVAIVPTFYEFDAGSDTIDCTLLTDKATTGKNMAKVTVDAAKADGVEAKGPVFIVTGPKSDYQSVILTGNQEEVFKDYPDLKVVEFECPTWGTDEAVKRVVDAFHAYGKPFAICGNNMTVSIGVVEGMKTAGIAVPRGQAGHVYCATFDGAQQIQDYMKEGLVDSFSESPNPHIDCLAQEICRIIKEKGVDGLPKAGTKVISDPSKPDGAQNDGTYNIVLRANDHKGKNPWALAPWAPCTMIEHTGHLQLSIPQATITRDKLDAYAKVHWTQLVNAWLA